MKLLVYMLGTGAAVPTKERGLPAIALKYLSDILLFDAGEGIQYKLIKMGLSPVKIKAIFITHMHGDHIFGLPGLLQTMAMYNRNENLIIHGPPGISDYIKSAISATYHKPQFNIIVIEDQEIFNSGNYMVRRFPVDHGIPSYGYVFEEKEKYVLDTKRLTREGIPRRLWGLLKKQESIYFAGKIIRREDYLIKAKGLKVVYTGDTRPTLSVVNNSLNADILIHDSTFDDDYLKEAHEEGHSTAGDAGKIAKLAKAKALVLTHISARYGKDTSILLADAKRYHNNVIVAEDYMIIPVG